MSFFKLKMSHKVFSFVEKGGELILDGSDNRDNSQKFKGSMPKQESQRTPLEKIELIFCPS